MYALQESRADPEEIQRIIEEIGQLIEGADALLSARDVQQRLNNAGREQIAKALRVAIERGTVEIMDNMKLRISGRGILPIATVGQ